jgi:quercetin dioxygenase-like cupin family protein
VSGPREIADAAFASEGLRPSTWSNEAGYRYGEHRHSFHKILYCISGSITFHTPDGDVLLGPGDRLDLPADTPHSATVGTDGVVCMEAPRP